MSGRVLDLQRAKLQFPGPADDAIVVGASALKKPCELHTSHSPVVVRTQGHHRFPVYLQNRVYGKIVIPDLLWICGTGHDSIHDWLPYALGDSTRRPDVKPGWKTMDEVEAVVDWYRELTAA